MKLTLSQVRSEINVTPLVDVVLVLLIIFMVVTPLSERELDVPLPDAPGAPMEAKYPVVALDGNGQISIDGKHVSDTDYVGMLSEALKHSGRVVLVEASDRASYGRVVSVVDGAKQAGASDVGLSPEPSDSAPQ